MPNRLTSWGPRDAFAKIITVILIKNYLIGYINRIHDPTATINLYILSRKEFLIFIPPSRELHVLVRENT